MSTKYVFMTGGVCSGLGKGITAASLGRLLKARGYRVTIQKFDPYINMLPGLLNPDQHGEVYVTDDGAEMDLDLGHYERFIDENLSAVNSVTAGRIYMEVLKAEQEGKYQGSTIQVIPHITNAIKEHICRAGNNADIIISEIGGTVGDIESLPFLEAIRQVLHDKGYSNVMYVHVTLVPYLAFADEMKTKPSQHSVKELLSLGIRPDALVCRTEQPLEDDLKNKLALFCNVKKEYIIENANVDCIYEVPLLLEDEKFADIVCERLQLEPSPADLTEWRSLVDRYKNARGNVNIGIICKYNLQDAYISVIESLKHAGIALDVNVNPIVIPSREITKTNIASKLNGLDGILIPAGYGDRDVCGLILAAGYARENKIPFLGIGLGMQCAVIEFARNMAELHEADSTEEKEGEIPCPLICPNPQLPTDPPLAPGGKRPMRGGTKPCKLVLGSHLHAAYGETLIYERFRHMYMLNNQYRSNLGEYGLLETAHSPDEQRVEAIELPVDMHPWFVGVQFRPEFKSRVNRPSPIIKAFLEVAIDGKKNNIHNYS